MGKVMHEDNTPFLNSNEQLSSAPGSSSSPRGFFVVSGETPGLGDASLNDLTQEQIHAYGWVANRFELFNMYLKVLSSVAVAMRFGSEGGDALFWLWGCYAVYLALMVLNFRYILPWLRRKHTELLKEDWRLSGTQARELSYQPDWL